MLSTCVHFLSASDIPPYVLIYSNKLMLSLLLKLVSIIFTLSSQRVDDFVLGHVLTACLF